MTDGLSGRSFSCHLRFFMCVFTLMTFMAVLFTRNIRKVLFLKNAAVVNLRQLNVNSVHERLFTSWKHAVTYNYSYVVGKRQL